MFQVGDRVKPKNPNSLFSHGKMVAKDSTMSVCAGRWMVAEFDEPPILYYLYDKPIYGANPCLVVQDTFEHE